MTSLNAFVVSGRPVIRNEMSCAPPVERVVSLDAAGSDHPVIPRSERLYQPVIPKSERLYQPVIPKSERSER